MGRGQIALLLLIAAAAGAFGLWLGRHQALPPEVPPPAGVSIANLGDPAPELSLPDLDGQTRALAAWRGRPLLINFWASWCGPCVEEMPLLARFAAEQGATGVQVLGIALDEAAAVRAYLERVPVGYPILLDVAGPADSSVRLGDTRGVLPYSVLLDAEGRVRAQKVGVVDEALLAAWVSSL